MKPKWTIPNLTFTNLKTIWNKPSKGFGDTFAKLAKTLGFVPCEGCERRRNEWNEKLKYRKENRDRE